MAAYHSIAVTLGQAGLLKELIKIIEWMRQKPSKKIRNMRHKNWDPVIEPDLVIYNAVRRHFHFLLFLFAHNYGHLFHSIHLLNYHMM